MKRFFTTTCIVFVAFLYLTAQESYYYCQERKIFLPENNLVKYVDFKNDLSADQAENLRRQLSEFCDRVGEYTPFFNKYFILEDKLNQFMKVIFDNDSLISLHTPKQVREDERESEIPKHGRIKILKIFGNLKRKYKLATRFFKIKKPRN